MKKLYFALIAIIVFSFTLQAQEKLKQVIVANGGAYANPDDYVTVGSYNLENKTYNIFGTIYTQSVQDILIDENIAYVSAQDSIVAFNIDTYERVASAEIKGINKLAVWQDKILVGCWTGCEKDFVKVLNKTDLSLIQEVNVSDQTFGLSVYGDKLYVAVPGAWGTAVSKIEIVNLTDFSVTEKEVPAIGQGIREIIADENMIFATNVNHAMEARGGVSFFNPTNQEVEVDTFTLAGGLSMTTNGLVKENENLYIAAYGSLKIYNTNTKEVTGSITTPNLASFDYDYVNEIFYGTSANYSGNGKLYTIAKDGTQTELAEVGISAEAMALDFRSTANIKEETITSKSKVYPNPFKDEVTVKTTEKNTNITICNMNGQVVYSNKSNSKINKINLSNLSAGVYILSIHTKSNVVVKRIVKH